MARRVGLAGRVVRAMMSVLMVASIAGVFRPSSAQGAPSLQTQSQTTYQDDACETLNDPSTTYVLVGAGYERQDGDYFTVPANCSSEASPITIILDNVNRSQEGKGPDSSFITIEEGNYVVVKLRGNNIIKAGTNTHFIDSDDGMAGIHVAKGSTVKVTSEEGDGSTAGSLYVHGGGPEKYGGAGIGSRYNRDCGTVIIAGGTIHAVGGHSASGIGSGRDGVATDVRITGGDIVAEGGKYAAGVGAGDNVAVDEGGDLYDLSITGGKVVATGGYRAAGIGCSEGGHLHGTILIENADVTATGGQDGAGIGGGSGADFEGSGRILIHGGTINATGGGNGAGIGGGKGTDGVRVVIDQTQGQNLSIKARGGYDASGIGSGDEDCDYVSITLRGGRVEGRGGENGAGIGGGDAVGAIDITGTGNVHAYGGQNGCGIGGGNNSAVENHLIIRGDSTGVGDRGLYIWAEAGCGRDEDNQAAAIGSGKGGCCNIEVSNAELVTSADNQGADIGGGSFHTTPGGTVDTITIDNCEIRSLSKHKCCATIGAGYGASVNHINISNTDYTGGGIGGGLMAVNYIGLNSVKSITIANSNIHAEWDETSPGDTPYDFTGFNESPLDHGAAGIGAGLFGSVDSIDISDSTIYAKGFGSGAGIGGGGAGSNSSIFGLDKLDIGNVGTISIRRSTVEARSGCADFSEGHPVTVDTGYKIYTIEPAQMGSGAGIGSGSGSGVETIEIEDCPIVIAKAHSGAGIGGGRGSNMIVGGWVGHIYLVNCGTVTASGGKLCAGIGTGGGDGLRGPTSCSLREIYIDRCKQVTATGGGYAAGIGCGVASPYEDADTRGGRTITIVDSTVRAKGGTGGAGIGGGVEQARTGYGGENPPILIKGDCRIEATGGDGSYDGEEAIGGGAGIGGGSDGGASVVEIDVTEDETTPYGTVGTPQNANYYVHAQGTDGGAGIGSGGSGWANAAIIKNTNDSDSIYIKSGGVFARGGNSMYAAHSRDIDHGLRLGAGAGIGGGSSEGTVDTVKVTGGYVKAEGGLYASESEQADDIGTGGDWSSEGTSERDSSGDLLISDGTVLAERIVSFAGTKRISGGSVSAIVDGARDAGGTPVFQTTTRLKDASSKKATLVTDVSYGTDHLYTTGDGILYPYLRERGSVEDKAQWADVTLGATDTRHCIGYTLTDHTGLLKLEGFEVPVKDPGFIRYSDDFSLELEDADGFDGATWTLEAEGAAHVVDGKSEKTSPGATASMHADALGTYTMVGKSDYTIDADYYWGSVAHFTDTVHGLDPEPAFVEDASKVYDGKPVEPPSVHSLSGAPVIGYAYFDAKGNPLDAAPKDVGTYTVEAQIAAVGVYAEGSCRATFNITKAKTTCALTFEASGATVRVRAQVIGLYEADGTVHFSVPSSTTYDYIPDRDIEVTEQSDGTFCAVWDAPEVSQGTYRVHARFSPSALNNYEVSSTYETRSKELADRVIIGDAYRTVPFAAQVLDLNMSTDHPSSDDMWRYEVVWDSWEQMGEEPAIVVDDKTGDVRVQHAGRSVIKVTLDTRRKPLYNKTSTYVTVTVTPAPLTVTSYAYAGSDMETPLETAHYGKLWSVRGWLSFEGLQGGDDAMSFTHGHGYLRVGTIPAELGAGEFHIPIERYAGTAEPVTIDGVTYENIFYARDYDLTLVEGTLVVEPATLAVEATQAHGRFGGAEPAYGWQLSQTQEYHGCDGLAKWDTVSSAIQTDPTVTLDTERAGGTFAELAVGRYFEVLVPAGGKAANYELVYLPGTLVIDEADLGDSGRFTATAKDTTYNGRPQKQRVTVVDKEHGDLELTESVDYTLAYPENVTDAGEVSVTVKGIGNYEGTCQATYTIERAPVTVVTESASKSFDGTPLTAPGTVEGIAETDAYEFRTTGSQTKVGWSDNGYELSFVDEHVRSNYRVRTTLGRLTVISTDIADCTVRAPEDVTYDGSEHKLAPQVTNQLGEQLVEGTDYELSWYGDVVNAGVVTVGVSGAGIYTGTTSVPYGILCAPLVAETDDATKVFDGRALTADGRLSGLAGAETASFATTGTITWPGTTANSYTLDWDGTAKRENYKLTEAVGTLTVNQNAGEANGIIAEDVHAAYDGTAHTVSAEAKLAGSTITYSTDGGASWSPVPPSFTDATSAPVEVLVRAEHAGYLHGTAEKTLTVEVTPAPLTVTTEGATKPYDGSPLTASGQVLGWVAGESAPFAVTGTLAHVGEVTNTYTIDWDDATADTLQGNYEVREELGTLSVTPATLKVITNGATKSYDGRPLTATGAMAGLVNGETATLQVTGTQTEVGRNENAARVVWDGSALASDYDVETSFGTLTVTLNTNPITITAPSATKPYDGKPLVADGTDEDNPVSVTGLPEGFTLEARAKGSQIDPGTSANSIDTYRILNAVGEERTDNFENVEVVPGTLTVTQATRDITFLESPTKVYDGKAVSDPAVSYTGDGALTYAYYDGQERPLAGAPIDAGEYAVVASVAETAGYAAASARLPFTITPAPTATHLTLAQSGTSATATASVEGLRAAEGSVTFEVNGNALGSVAVTQGADGRMQASLTVDPVPSGKYTVVARYVPTSGNYQRSQAQASGNKDLASRSIAGKTQWEKTYGDGPFALGLSTDCETANDTWSYKVVYDAHATLGFEPAVSVAGDGTVTVHHAGTAMIEATLSDGLVTYNDVSVFVAVHVKPKPLTVRSRALDGSVPVDARTYGTLDGLTYDIALEGLIAADEAAGDVTHGHGTLKAVAIDEESAVRDAPYEIAIIREGAPLTVGDTTYESVFVARDYEINEIPGTLRVTPADLSDESRFTASAEDTTYTGDVQHQPVCVRDANLGNKELIEKTDYTLAYTGGAIDAGPVTVTITGKGNYTGKRTCDYTIDPAPFTVVTDGAERAYDGRPLTALGEIGGLVAEETATLVTTGSQTEVGSSTNTYKISWDGTAKETNYVLAGETLGRLTVTKNPTPVTITAPSAEKTYNGTPLVATGEVLVDGLPQGFKVTATVSGEQTDAGVGASVVDDYKIVDDSGGDQTASFTNVQTLAGTLTVKPARLVVETKTASKVYDGEPLEGEGTLTGLVDGESARFTVTGMQTRVGSSPNTYDLVFNQTAKEGNYIIEEHVGTLTVTESADQVVVTTTGGTFTYDGRAHGATVEVSGLKPGYELVDARSLASVIDVTDTPVTCTADVLQVRNAEGEDVTERLNLVYVDGTIEVAPAQLTVTTPDAEKVFDGVPLTAAGTMTGLVAGERALLVTTGSQFGAGSSLNTYKVVWNGTAKEHNYDIVERVGTLMVTPSEEPVTLTAPSATEPYDGVALVAAGPVTAEGLPEGYTVSARATGRQMGVGSSENPLDEDFTIWAPDGTELTASFANVTLVPGTLTVEPATLRVTTPTKEKPYDGTPLTAAGTIEGLATGETVSFKTTGSQTEVGTSENSYTLDFDGTADEANYAVLEDIGTLSVTRNPSGTNAITATGWQGTYDGKEHAVTAAATLPGSTLTYSTDGGATWTAVSPAVRDVTAEPVYVDVRATNDHYVHGEAEALVLLQVAPAPLVVTTESATKAYDGEPLVAGGTVSGLVAKESVGFEATGSQTVVGSSPNTYRLTWDGTAREDNYEIREDLGTLTVTEPAPGPTVPLDPELAILQNPTKIYDGVAVTDPAVSYLGTGTCTLTYYDEDGAPLAASPTDVGSYEVVARLSATKEYRAATASVAFAIAPAPTSTTLTVTRNGAGATCTARIEGLYAPEGTVRFTANGYVLGTVAVESGVDGAYVASLGIDAVPEGDYEVVASFTPETENYVASRDTRLVHRDALERTIIGTTSYEKTYGDAPFALDLATDVPTTTDVWSYEVVFDGHETLGFESAVSIAGGGMVEVRHAGRSIVCVTLTDTAGVYDEAIVLVEVVVAPAELTVTSFAKSDGERVSSAAYGTLVDLDYSLDYEGLTKGDGPGDFTHGHGTLEAIPVKSDANASTDPYDIAIAQVGAPLEVAGREYENVFVARDYSISYVMEELDVVPAMLTVRTDSASKPFDGTALTAPGHVDGLVGDETVSLVVTGSQTEVGSSVNGYRLTWDGTAKESNYEVKEDLGTLTVTQAVVSYFYVGEADPAWTQRSGKALTLTYKRSVLDETTYDHFQGIRVDGVEVAEGSFDARKGSVVIDLLPSFLSRLTVGKHVATAVFDDGVAPDVAFSVKEAGGGDDPVNPVTPDEPVVPWVPVNPVNPVTPPVPITPINPYVPVVPDGPKTPDSPETPVSPSKPETQPTAAVTPSGTSPSASGGSTVATPVTSVATQAPVAATSVVGGQVSSSAAADTSGAPQRVPATGDSWRWGPVISLVLAGVGAVTLGRVLRRWRRE